MKKREAIIVSIAVLIGIYGLLDTLVFSGKSRREETGRMTAAVEGIASFVQTAETGLSATARKNDFQDMAYLISKAEAEWEKDPFRVYPSEYEKEPSEAGDLSRGLIYSGFIKAGGRCLAVINGLEYTTGETIRDRDLRIAGIAPDELVLLTEFNQQIILRLEEE